MKIRPTPSGSFANNIYFDEGEIDAIMEEHYYGFWNGKCDFDQPALDMDKFISEYLGPKGIEYDSEASSQEFGVNVLGKTIFNPDGSKLILINKTLRQNRHRPGGEGRYNFTAAHESFHALQHGPLFDFPRGQLQIGLEQESKKSHACLNRDVVDDNSGERQTPWQETQANRGASSLLMPKTLFSQHFERERKSYGIDSGAALLARADRLDAVIGYLSRTFGASKQAVKYRILSLKLLQDEMQLEFDGVSGGEGAY